jgi:hypothetical protein
MGRTDGWSLSSSEDEMTLSGTISDGSTAIGCLKTRLSGLSLSEYGTLSWSGTFEDLGVPAGVSMVSIGVNGVADFNWKCSEYTLARNPNEITSFGLTQSNGVLIGNFINSATAISGTTSWAGKSGYAISIPTYDSSDSIELRILIRLTTGLDLSSAISLLIDQISLDISYEIPTTTLQLSSSEEITTIINSDIRAINTVNASASIGIALSETADANAHLKKYADASINISTSTYSEIKRRQIISSSCSVNISSFAYLENKLAVDVYSSVDINITDQSTLTTRLINKVLSSFNLGIAESANLIFRLMERRYSSIDINISESADLIIKPIDKVLSSFNLGITTNAELRIITINTVMRT